MKKPTTQNKRFNILLLIAISFVIVLNIYPVIYLIIKDSFDMLIAFNACGIILMLLILNVYKSSLDRKSYREDITEEDILLYKYNKRYIFGTMIVEIIITIVSILLSL